MIKLIILACLVYLAYRLFAGRPLLPETKRKSIDEQEKDDNGFADYEEVD